MHLRSLSVVQQGCPLAPFLFALVLQDLISHLNPNSLILTQWYLDDGHLAGKNADILEALKMIDIMGPERGILPIELDVDLKLVLDLGLEVVRDGMYCGVGVSGWFCCICLISH
jgi:hypothetical protein